MKKSFLGSASVSSESRVQMQGGIKGSINLQNLHKVIDLLLGVLAATQGSPVKWGLLQIMLYFGCETFVHMSFCAPRLSEKSP